MYDFKDKVAVVTGASGGMGQQISLDLMNAGARVIMMDLKDEPEEAKYHSGNCLFCQGDVTNEDFVNDSINHGVEKFGRLDFLVNAAGILLFGVDESVVDMDLNVWDRVFDVNIKACAYTVRASVPYMKKHGGAMVHISTIQCYRGDDKPQDAYQASKAGLIALSKSLAIQFAAQGIRSNIIAPGMIQTPLQARWEQDLELKEAITDYVPLKRIGDAKDISNACLFLLSTASSYITGTEVIVDGGLLAKP